MKVSLARPPATKRLHRLRRLVAPKIVPPVTTITRRDPDG